MSSASHDGGFGAWWSNHPDLTGLTPHGVAQLAWNAARSETGALIKDIAAAQGWAGDDERWAALWRRIQEAAK